MLVTEPPSCVACDSAARREPALADVLDYLTDERFAIDRCPGCGLLVTRPAPSEEEIGRYYPPRYRGNRHSFTGSMRIGLRRRALAKHFAKGFRGRLLDIGAGNGAFAMAMGDAGWDVAATEIAPAAVDRLRAAGIDAKSPADAARDGFAGGAFDAITCWHVLEHVHRPDEMARQAASLLRPDGIFQATVPNVASRQAKLAGRHWLHLDVPRHLFHFDESNLRQLLGRARLETVAVSCFAIEYDWFGVIQSGLNAVTARPNFLFEKLMGSPAPATTRDRVISYLLAGPLAAVGLPACLLGWALGNGATLTATCRLQSRR